MTGERMPPGMNSDQYDPTKVINEIDQIKKERTAQLEGVIHDKDIKVFNTNSGTGVNLKQLLF